jgi:hypothetical protein
MPAIRQYEVGQANLRLSGSDVAVQSSAQAARVIGGLYGQAANEQRSIGDAASSAIKVAGEQAVKFVEHRELSAGLKDFAALQLELNRTWDSRAQGADGNDPSVAARYREEVLNPALEKFQEGFWTEKGRDWAMRSAASIREHMDTKTAADMVSLAKRDTKENTTKTLNLLTNTVKGDPSSLDFALSTWKSGVDAVVDGSPVLRGAGAQQLRRDLGFEGSQAIVLAALTGAIERDPEAGIKLASDPRYAQYVSGEKVKQLEAYARQNIRAQQAEERMARQEARLAAIEKSDKIEDAYITSLYAKEKPGDKLEIMKIDGLSREAKARLVRLVEHELKPETAAAVSRATTSDVLRRMGLPPDDPDKITTEAAITDLMIDQKLSRADYAFLRQELAASRTEDGEKFNERRAAFFKGVQHLIDKSNPLMGKIDEGGAHEFYKFQVDLIRQANELRRRGESPFQLLDPDSPHYMGRPERLAPFQRTMAESIAAMTERLGGGNTIPERRPLPPDMAARYPGGWLERDGSMRVETVGPTGERIINRIVPRR